MFDSIRSDAMIWNWVKTTHYSVLLDKLFQNACWLEFVETLTSWPGTEAGDFPDVYPVDVAHPSSWAAQWAFRSHDKRCSAPLWPLPTAVPMVPIRKLWASSEFHFTDSGTTGYRVKNRCLEASGQFLSWRPAILAPWVRSFVLQIFGIKAWIDRTNVKRAKPVSQFLGGCASATHFCVHSPSIGCLGRVSMLVSPACT